jgi:DNA polymerase-1
LRVAICDLETDGLLDTVTTIWCMGIFDVEKQAYTNYSDVPESNSPSIDEGLKALQGFDVVVFHNGFNYDIPAIEKLRPGNPIDPKRVQDTMVMSRLLDPERGSHTLESLGESIGFPKGSYDDWTKWTPEMESYLRQDVRLTYRLWKKFSKALETWGESVQLEHDVAWVISLQMRNGFGFNTPEAVKLLGELQQEKFDKEEQLKTIFPPILVPLPPAQRNMIPKRDDAKRGYVAGAPFSKVVVQEFNPGSRQQIAERLVRKYGWVPTVYTEGGAPEVSEAVLKELTYPEADPTAEYLRLDKMVGMLNSPKKRDGSGGGWLVHEKDGRIYGYVNPNGAVTGRMTHSKPNVAQADKDERMRSLWIPRKGWVLVGCDAESLELCMMGHYLARYDGGEFLESVVSGDKKKGTDAHTRNQRIVVLHLRDSAKTFIYALIYGAGNEKLGSTILADSYEAGKDVAPEYLALKPKKMTGSGMVKWKKAMGKLARDKIEKGIKGFKELRLAVQAKAKNPGYLIGLDGRRVTIRSPHSALNTLFQSAGAIVMKKALQIFHDHMGGACGASFAYCANVHDEVQMEAEEAYAELLGREFAAAITEAGVALKVRCPLSGSFDIGSTWAETH